MQKNETDLFAIHGLIEKVFEEFSDAELHRFLRRSRGTIVHFPDFKTRLASSVGGATLTDAQKEAVRIPDAASLNKRSVIFEL